MATGFFKPALIVVDFQEDFCPPNGSLAVTDGRAIAPIVNSLLALPFACKVATKDWHPPEHKSFASNHPNAEPFISTTTIVHPESASTPAPSYDTRLWPIHCVQGTAGAALVPELEVARCDRIIEKGTDPRVEMYSAFYDPFRVCDSGLVEILRREGITHVYVVGLAADYCVRHTAVDAAKEGFVALIVEEGTRAVVPKEWENIKGGLEGVTVVSVNGEEIRRVRELVRW